MVLEYKIIKNIGILQNPQQIDISTCKKVCFKFDCGEAILELNKTNKLTIDKDGCCCISINLLKKGTNTLRVILKNEIGLVIYPCQPFMIFDYNDSLYCTLATSLDMITIIDKIQEKLSKAEEKIAFLEKLNPEAVKETLNKVVDITNDLQLRVVELEKNFDPTV